MTWPHALLVFFAALLGVAAWCDVFMRRIPNRITVAVAAAGLLSSFLTGGARAVALGLLAGLGTGLLFAPLWARRAMGGGDLKLAAACAVWVGLSRAPSYLFASCLAGGALALVCYAFSSAAGRGSIRANLHRFRAPAWPEAAASPGRPVLVPYGAAFAAGALWAVLGR